ncbi:MAG: hypothetical protein IKX97_03850 [Erysipelotrichaceae bacterium]|nr:hypothetical protein [Erysipelotrichaceae bacterium]MBR5754937.1 hypothetical protein [Erysipelotrichaceae bacterium]
MALYVRTKLNFEGDPERIQEITESLKNEKDPIDFRKIIPLSEDEDMEEKWGITSLPEELDVIVYRNGTKAEFSFDTEKNKPLKIYEELGKMFPDCHMTINYAYEDYGNDCGIYESEEGSSELTFKEPDDPFVFACDVWEVDPDEEMNERMINFYEE